MFFLQILFAGVSVGVIYALVGLGLNFTYWTTRVISFAHGPLMMITVMSILAMVKLGSPFWLSVTLGLILVALLALFKERFAVRPVLMRGGSSSWVVSTLGMGIALQAFAAKIWGSEVMAFPDIIFSSTDYVEILGVRLSSQMLLILFASILIVGFIQLAMHKTMWGKAMKAVARDKEAALTSGINAKAVIVVSYIISGLLAGIAGILIGPITGVDPAFGMSLMLKGFIAVIIGGIGSSTGTLIGGISLGVLEMLASGYIDASGRDAVAFVVLIIILAIRPHGLFGEREVVKV